ncbi:D-alanyl-D-alanine carboxypeptidase (penicillin-binding protein 5/6) [Cryobacterium mesophilum]|uniref:D-alanyl-D-alanine carboxypeptidase family protein n=1 Tax=Terrimesophilobacter mesophilus TaxID=433647 RepID=UPI0014257B37|nr:serine hydrolase [Terrimesophilobacter mesophilus]MBB5633058.1 D-alanyl-D-alanine carboxypeptidase (penicillin-binding protein 5/6) [Terrimesophilobacter mesophilus]
MERDDSDEQRRRRRRRAWIAVGAIALVIAVALGSYIGVVLNAPLPKAAAVMVPIVPPATPPVAITLPETGASAVSVSGADEFAGTKGKDGVLASSGGNAARPIASISKVITTLVILDRKPLAADEPGPIITFTKADHKLYDSYYVRGATIQPMDTGSTMSLHDALELMLVVSASNYAEAVSTWAFGSQANFLAAAHSWLAKNGMKGTTFVDPSGIDPRNTSTPTDLLTLGRLAMANPLVASLVGLQTTDVPGFSGMPNTNTLLGSSDVDGIKTGTLDEAGSCLLYSATFGVGATQPITVTGIILGGLHHSAVAADAATVINDIREGFHAVTLVKADDVLGHYTTVWGERADIVAERSASLLTWSDSPITVTSHAKVVGPGKARMSVGSATFTGEGGTQTVLLVLAGTLEEPDAWWRITHPAELFGG